MRNEYETALQYVQENVGRRARLEQVAEEAAELAHAALKLIRAEGTDNPTPKDWRDARKQLWEEVADVENTVAAMGYIPEPVMFEMRKMKMKRWADRVEEWNKQEGKHE